MATYCRRNRFLFLNDVLASTDIISLLDLRTELTSMGELGMDIKKKAAFIQTYVVV